MKYLTILSVLISFPTIALAHTRWFAVDNPLPYNPTESTGLYLSILAIVAIILIVIGYIFQQKNYLNLRFLKPTKPQAFAKAAATFTMVTGAFFVIAGTHEYLFSPNLTTDSGIPTIFIYLQIAIGLSFMVGLVTRLSAMLLAVLWGTTFFIAGFIPTIENIWILSTAVFVAVMGNDYFSLVGFSFLRHKIQEAYKRYALSILRIGTGLTLVILGFSEKLAAPELGLSFLDQHHFNFMKAFGLPYSDYLFTLSAGTFEIIFGLIFVLGILTRFNALMLTIIFALPVFFLGPIELAGHLPHFAAILLLLFFGSGGHFTIGTIHKEDKLHLP